MEFFGKEKHTIKAGDESVVNSIKGDNNNIYNLAVIDKEAIKGVVSSILADSLPTLQTIAKEQMDQSIKLYVDDFIKRIVSEEISSDIVYEKLSTPSVQYAIYKTAKTYALSPSSYDRKTLLELVIKKISIKEGSFDEDNLIDIVISAASKMNIYQIRFLSLLYFLSKEDNSLSSSKDGIRLLDPAFNFSFSKPNDKFEHKGIKEHYEGFYTETLSKIFPLEDIIPVSLLIPKHFQCITSLDDYPTTPPNSRNPISINLLLRTNFDITLGLKGDRFNHLQELLDKLGGLNKLKNLRLTPIGVKIAQSYLDSRIKILRDCNDIKI